MKVQGAIDKAAAEPAFAARLAADPVAALNEVASIPEPLQNDRFIYRWGAFTLGLVPVLVVLGFFVLAWYGKTQPAEIATLAATALAALALLMSRKAE